MRDITFSGVSCYSSDNTFSYALSLTLFLEGVRYKVYAGGFSESREGVKQAISSIIEGLRSGSGLNTQSMKTRNVESFLIINGNYTLSSSLGYYFSGKSGLKFFFPGRKQEAFPPSGSIGSGWIILPRQGLNKTSMNLMLQLLKSGVTPKSLTLNLAKSLEDLVVSVAAVNVNAKDPRLLKGSVSITCYSDRGRVRKNNEDACFASSLEISTLDVAKKYQILGVADGAGGHGYGEVASRETALGFLKNMIGALIEEKGNIGEALRNSISLVNEEVLSLKARMGSDMASTLSVAVIRGRDVFIGHVGDSRVYALNTLTGEIAQLTRDHKYVEDLVEAGKITREEARVHPQRNIITSAIGMRNPRIDVLFFSNLFDEKRKIIVCSDGLSDLVRDEEISHTVTRNKKATTFQVARELINLANKRGGLDNISVSMAEYLL